MSSSAHLFGGGAQRHQFLYVANMRGGDVTIIEIPKHEIVGTIGADRVGHSPSDIVASADGRTVYLNRPEKEDVVGINTDTQELIFTAPVGGIPHYTTLSADGQLLFVPIFNYRRLEVIDLRAGRVIRTIPVGWGAYSTRLSHDGRLLYVGHLFGKRIIVIDVTSLNVVRTLRFPDGVLPFQISRDGRTLYVQLSNLHGFVVADAESGRIQQTVHMTPHLPVGTDIDFPFTVDQGLALSPDGKRLVAAGSTTDNLIVYSLPDMAVLANIAVGGNPSWVVIEPEGAFAYVTNRKDNTLSVISMADLQEVRRLKVGNYPQCMAFADFRPEFKRGHSVAQPSS